MIRDANLILQDLVNEKVIEEVPETKPTMITGLIQDQAILSIAISLKRIADSITHDPNSSILNIRDLFSEIVEIHRRK